MDPFAAALRGTRLRTAYLVSSCFCGSFLPIHHNSFFFSPNLWNQDRYNRSTVQFLRRVQWVWKCLCHVVCACLSVCLPKCWLSLLWCRFQTELFCSPDVLLVLEEPFNMATTCQSSMHPQRWTWLVSVGSCREEGNVIYELTVMLLSQIRTNNHIIIIIKVTFAGKTWS